MKILWMTSVLCAALMAASTGFGQDEVMVLKSEALEPHERALVSFPHERHADLIDCLRCHHDFDAYGGNVGSEGQRCSDCHDLKGSGNPVPLMRAFHLQCKNCHQKVEKSAEGAPLPIMCGQCHAP